MTNETTHNGIRLGKYQETLQVLQEILDELGIERPKVSQTPKYSKKDIPESLRWAVWERDNFTCQECGRRQYLTVDHILAESRGGELSMENCQTLCRRCNSKKGTK